MLWSQYLVIWYGDLPEEARFIHHRMHGAWAPVAWTVFAAVFAVPFMLLLSRKLKMRPAALGAVAGWCLPASGWSASCSSRRRSGGGRGCRWACRNCSSPPARQPVRALLRQLPGPGTGTAAVGSEAGTGRRSGRRLQPVSLET